MKLQLSRNLILTIDGPVTHKIYKFPGVGSVVEVDDEDGEIMKMRMSAQSCCGGSEPSPYFHVVEEAIKKPASTRSNAK
jgi:hypothetical protein